MVLVSALDFVDVSMLAKYKDSADHNSATLFDFIGLPGGAGRMPRGFCRDRKATGTSGRH
jgi:hypothetical protein